MFDVVFRTKQALLGFDCPEPTKAEQKKFLRNVFNRWDSTRAHQLPDLSKLTSGLKDKSIVIGTLSRNHPTAAELKEEGDRRGLDSKVTKSRGSKNIRDNWSVPTANKYRRAGAQVLMRASLKNNAEVNIDYVDEQGRYLPKEFSMTYFPGMSERRAFFEAFCQYDEYEATTINEYNLRVATFIARNRITTWANGLAPTVRPINEPFDHLIELNTIRDKVEQIPEGDMRAAYQNLLESPKYTLYPDIPTED